MYESVQVEKWKMEGVFSVFFFAIFSTSIHVQQETDGEFFSSVIIFIVPCTLECARSGFFPKAWISWLFSVSSIVGSSWPCIVTLSICVFRTCKDVFNITRNRMGIHFYTIFSIVFFDFSKNFISGRVFCIEVCCYSRWIKPSRNNADGLCVCYMFGCLFFLLNR